MLISLKIGILLMLVPPYVFRLDDFQSDNHKDKSSQREIMKKKKTSKRSVFQDPSFIRSLCKVPSFPIDFRSRFGRGNGNLVLGAKSPRGWIGTIIQLYCLKAWFGSLELVEPQAWD
ncbi:hypothetical protein AAG906_038575 [Vitis piasezkii]